MILDFSFRKNPLVRLCVFRLTYQHLLYVGKLYANQHSRSTRPLGKRKLFWKIVQVVKSFSLFISRPIVRRPKRFHTALQIFQESFFVIFQRSIQNPVNE